MTTVSPPGGVFATPVMVTLTCTDNAGGSGCNEILYCLGTACTPAMVYTGPIAVNSTSDLSFFSKDAAGNMELLRTESYTIGTPAVAQTSGIGAAQAMDLLPDGGYVLAGDTSFAGSLAAQLWVMRLGADNSVVWRFTYDAPFPLDTAEDVRATSDGGIIVLASSTNLITLVGDILVIKLDADGMIQWQNLYGGAATVERARSIRETATGEYVIAGKSSGNGGEAIVLKLTAMGVPNLQLGFPALDEATAIRPTSDGGTIVAGTTIDVGAGNQDAWAMKLMPDGMVDWQFTYGTLSSESAVDIETTPDGGYAMLGQIVTTQFNLWAVKLFADGSVDWQKVIGGGSPDFAGSMRVMASGNYALAGATASFGTNFTADAWFIELDGLGGIVTQVAYGDKGNDQIYAIEPTADLGFALAGLTTSFGTPGLAGDTWFLKLDNLGNIGGMCTAQNATPAIAADTSAAKLLAVDLGSIRSFTTTANIAVPVADAVTSTAQCQ